MRLFPDRKTAWASIICHHCAQSNNHLDKTCKMLFSPLGIAFPAFHVCSHSRCSALPSSSFLSLFSVGFTKQDSGCRCLFPVGVLGELCPSTPWIVATVNELTTRPCASVTFINSTSQCWCSASNPILLWAHFEQNPTLVWKAGDSL